jgi:hypothetical protein
MRRLVMVPDGWPCKLGECLPGHFVFKDRLCFKDQYGSEGNSYNEAGEIFWGGVSSEDERQELIVQPVNPLWEEYEE